ncbi:cell wall hydrolase [Sphingomonas lacunae]|nr:cell wall hydrolase [Sphingomonas lacunae]
MTAAIHPDDWASGKAADGRTARPFGRPPRSGGRVHRSRRWLLLGGMALVPALLLGSHQLWGNPFSPEPYSVSVPVTLKPYDAQLWSLVNATSFDAAREIAPDLPDPTALPTVAELAGGDGEAALPPANAAAMRMEAYVGPPPTRYVFRGATATDTARAHYCLTAALYYEAASESDDGMRAVAQVVLNRVRHPSFPGSVCGVVFQGSQRPLVCQFTFACDGAMARSPSRTNWSRASRIAAEALAGRTFPAVGVATHYHTTAIWPSWGRSLAMTNIVGAHIFHRWRGRYGTPAAFSRPYSGREPAPGPYLPIAAQLAARAGRNVPSAVVPGTVAAGVTPAMPAGAPAGAPDAATVAAINAARNVPVAGTAATAAAPVPAPINTPGFSQPPVPVAAQPAPSYADPRLNRSGTVREEWRDSGTNIRR